MSMSRTRTTPRSRSKKVSSEVAGDGKSYKRSYTCSAKGCGKAFTRSEHLRRHQLNRRCYLKPFVS
jgi:hypothetical protein